MLTLPLPRRLARGFTLVELMVTIAILSILIMAAAPAVQEWILNARVRSTAEALQNGLRQAQTEAVRRSRQVVFVLTNGDPQTSPAAAVNGVNWYAQTVVGLTDTTADFIRGGRLLSLGAGVTVTSATSALCFNSIGALAANAAPGPAGAACTVTAATPNLTFSVAHTNATARPLQVVVSNGGRIRMCDPSRTVATSPDGC